MKILLINKFLYPKGGDAISALNTGKLFTANGHQVIFLGMQHPNNPVYPYSDYFIPHIDFNDPGGLLNKLKAVFNMFYSLDARNMIEKVIKIERPDMVHLHNYAHQISPSILHVFKRHNIPVVMTMHDYKLVCASYRLISKGKVCELCSEGRHYNCFLQGCFKDSRLKSLLGSLEMYLHHNILNIYSFIDIFISPSQFLKEKIEKMGFKKKVVYLPNFIDLNDFAPSFDYSEKEVYYVGRLSEEKGLATLIEAVKNIPDITLKIIGEGPARKLLEEKIRNNSQSNVLFLGYKNKAELKEEIKKAMFAILPSEWHENNPLSIIESFALGKPVLGARIGGIPELVRDNETGFTFESGNANDLRSKLEYLIGSPEQIREMGNKARAFVVNNFNAEKYYSDLLGIYNEVLKRHR